MRIDAQVTRIVMHRRGVAALLQSDGVSADIDARAERVRTATEAAVADGYPVVATRTDTVTKGRGRFAAPRHRAAVIVFGAHSADARSSAATALLSGLDAAQ